MGGAYQCGQSFNWLSRQYYSMPADGSIYMRLCHMPVLIWQTLKRGMRNHLNARVSMGKSWQLCVGKSNSTTIVHLNPYGALDSRLIDLSLNTTTDLKGRGLEPPMLWWMDNPLYWATVTLQLYVLHQHDSLVYECVKAGPLESTEFYYIGAVPGIFYL